jgi:hypothetical protein
MEEETPGTNIQRNLSEISCGLGKKVARKSTQARSLKAAPVRAERSVQFILPTIESYHKLIAFYNSFSSIHLIVYGFESRDIHRQDKQSPFRGSQFMP